jgi:hypothetical protein
MEWQIHLYNDEGYGEVITRGIADLGTSANMVKDISKNMRNNHITKILIDHRAIDGFSGDPIDVYVRPELLRIMGVVFNIKIAELISPQYGSQFRFFETVCFNHGFQLKFFHEKEEALKWLL